MTRTMLAATTILALLAESQPTRAATGARKVTAIVAGNGAACAAMDDGTVRCWGRNDLAERGTARGNDDAATPVAVPGVSGVTALVMGGDPGSAGDAVCATTKDGAVTCWGHTRLLPGGSKDGTPAALAELKGTQIVPGGGSMYALRPDGTVLGWGSPAFNALNSGSASTSDLPPTPIPGVSGAKMVAAGMNHACALLGDGTVSCWGYATPKQPPTPVAGVTGATALFALSQGDDTCALLADKTATCWGASGKVRPLAGLAGVKKLAGQTHWCALTEDGAVSCWGNNARGQVGHARSASTNKPERVAGLAAASDIAGGLNFSCAALQSGGAACWGFNQRGQLGDGTLMDRATPADVEGLTADTLPPVKDGLAAVQEGTLETSWDGMPAACKRGELKIAMKGYESGSFPVKAASARSQLEGKTIEISLADHKLYPTGWNPPRGQQGRLGLRLARFDLANGKHDPVKVDTGEYTLDTKVERVVVPSMALKNRNATIASISLAGVDAGKMTVTYLDDKWVCGKLALKTDSTAISGSFAAPILAK